MATEKRLIDANAIPESATAISTDGRLYVAWSAIVDAPTVDAVEVVYGRWIMDEWKHQYCCSVCGTVQPYDSIEDYIDHEIVYYDYWDCNYCPNCGARMDLEV